MIDGELWSFLRAVLDQGRSIEMDNVAGRYETYEHLSARLDMAARERADELSAILRDHSGEARKAEAAETGAIAWRLVGLESTAWHDMDGHDGEILAEAKKQIAEKDHDLLIEYAYPAPTAASGSRPTSSEPDAAMWRPMETAPRDGSCILLWVGYPMVARWDEEPSWAWKGSVPCWTAHATDDDFYSLRYEADRPTNWMPLPTAPGIEQRARELAGKV